MEHTLLSAGLLDLISLADADKAVVGLEFLQGFDGVVDEGEAGGLSTTIVRAQTEDGDLFLVGLVEIAELAAELVLGDVGAARVQDVTVASRNKLDIKSHYQRFDLAGIVARLPFPVDFQIIPSDIKTQLPALERLTRPSASGQEARCG